jgi:hypothetical protein
MRRTLVLLVLVVSFACGNDAADEAAESPAPTAPATPTPTPRPTADLGKLDIAKVMDHVRALAVDIGFREAGTPGDKEAQAYIAERIERIGWTATQQRFPLPQGGSSTNVIGTPPGFTDSEPYLIVGGHYDSLRGPGANDNATGVGIALDIARSLDVRPAAYPVMFVAFGAEERQPAPDRPHHIGSVFFVSKMSEAARKNLISFVNLDMVGHGTRIACGRLAVGPREGTQRCLDQGKKLGFDVYERVTPDWSDHGSFAKKGLNTSWLWTGDLPCCYHNPRDTIEVVRKDDVRRSGILGLQIIRSYTR